MPTDARLTQSGTEAFGDGTAGDEQLTASQAEAFGDGSSGDQRLTAARGEIFSGGAAGSSRLTHAYAEVFSPNFPAGGLLETQAGAEAFSAGGGGIRATHAYLEVFSPNVSPAVANDGGVFYWPWLTGDAPVLLSEVEDILTGQKITASGQIVATNTHQFWDKVVALDGNYWWKGALVGFFAGGSYNGQQLALDEWKRVRTMRVEDVAPDEVACVFKLAPLARLTERTVPVTPFFESSYPRLGNGVRGTKKWIGYGRGVMVPDLTDTAANQFTIADAAFQTLFAVHTAWMVDANKTAAQTLTPGTHYTVDLTACTITLTAAAVAAYPLDQYALVLDVTGKPDGAGGYLSTFGAIAKDLLQTFLGVSTDQIDEAAFVQADHDAPSELAVWLKDPRALSSIFSTNEPDLPCLERSVGGTIFQTTEGKWSCKIWYPAFDPATTLELTKADFAAFSPDPKLETVYDTVTVYYGQRRGWQDGWTAEQQADARVRALLGGSSNSLDVYTFLRSGTDAQRQAQRYMYVAGAVSLEVEFEERGARLAEHVAGDKVLVTFSPAPTSTGAFALAAFELLRHEVTWAPTMRVRGRLGKVKGITAYIGHWTNGSAPNWASATAEQRLAQGFWADSNGDIVPGDVTTRNKSLWW